jgi:hypothetical protein
LQKYFNLDFLAINNANLYAALLRISKSNLFKKKFNMRKIRNALSKSKLFVNNNISTLEISILTIQIINFLLFKYLSHLIKYLKSNF